VRDDTKHQERRALVAEDGGFGGGDFDAHEAMIFVEEELDFEVGGGGADGFGVGPAADGGGTGGFDGDVAGS
jgi:hypothetical protein